MKNSHLFRYSPNSKHVLQFHLFVGFVFLYSVLFRVHLFSSKNSGQTIVSPFFELTRLFAVAVGVIMVWKGLYSLIDLHFMSKNPILGNIMATMIGFCILYLIGGEKTISNVFG